MDLDAAPQPVIDGTPAEVALNPEASGDGSSRQERHVNGPNGFNGGDNEGGLHAPWAQAAPRRAQPA